MTRASRFVATLLIAACWPAADAATRRVAYVAAQGLGAYLIEWRDDARAHVVSSEGRAGGHVARSGKRTVVTLDTPISTESFEWVECEDWDFGFALVRKDTLQVVVHHDSGTVDRGRSTIATTGTVTVVEGCRVGAVTPFGAVTDPGMAMDHLSMALRPSVADLVPGSAIAGPAEDLREEVFGQRVTSADLLTLQAGGLGRFAATGTVVSAAFDADGWLVLGLPGGGERAYTRLAVDSVGAETWLDADWSDGAPLTVHWTLMVKPTPGAGFGSVGQAARVWRSGITPGFYIALYRDLSGERIGVSPRDEFGPKAEIRSPITWQLVGDTLVQRREAVFPFPPPQRSRTWRPIAVNRSGGVRFVLEEEVFDWGATFIKSRVNYWYDQGEATEQRRFGPPYRDDECTPPACFGIPRP